jgi:hypothetical protein
MRRRGSQHRSENEGGERRLDVIEFIDVASAVESDQRSFFA